MLFSWEVRVACLSWHCKDYKCCPFHFHCRGKGSAYLIALLDFNVVLFFLKRIATMAHICIYVIGFLWSNNEGSFKCWCRQTKSLSFFSEKSLKRILLVLCLNCLLGDLVKNRKKKSSAMCIIYFSDTILIKVAWFHEYEFHRII